MKYCDSCGKKIKQENKYCHNCGKNFTELKTNKNTDINKKSKVSFLELYSGTLSKFASFSGRASRKEYWTFYFINMLIAILISFIEVIFIDSTGSISNMFNLIMVMPSIAVGVRRMHDVNYSGLYLIVPIVNLVFLLRKGSREVNRFGLPTKI